MRMLTEDELNGFFVEHFTPDRYRTAFRLELLPEYAVGTDGDDFHRWVAGEPEPTWERKNQVLQVIRDETAAGLVTERVKVMSRRPTDYERYACEWGYAYNGPAGERIRIWDLARRALPAGIVDHDFWLLGDDAVLAMRYDRIGRFLGAALPDNPRPYVLTRDAMWAAAEPFDEWWAARPELRRHRRAA